MINYTRKPRYGYEDLLEIIRLLRSPEGCPWDRVQTHQSIRRGMLEEAYEAAEAIDTDNAALLKEELGDVLMQVVFHAGIEADAGRFDMDDVCDGTNVEEELGDVLFAAVKVGRFCGVDPETAVNGTCEKFIRRFRAMEEAAAAEGRSLSDMTLEEMTALWNGAKECS